MTFLDYAASQEEAIITYHASAMVLECHSNASYLSETGERSRAGGHFSCQVMQKCQPTMGPF